MSKELLGVYLTHDNGGRAFRVENYSDRQLIVYVIKDSRWYEHVPDKHTDNYLNDKKNWKEEIKFNYIEIWVGIDPSMPIWGIGNSILINEHNLTYVHIGESIRRFEMKIPIIGFLSLIGNNDVPYPYAFTESSYVIFAVGGRADRKGRIVIIDEMNKIEREPDTHEVFDPSRIYYDALDRYHYFKDKKLAGHNIISAEMIVERILSQPSPRD